MSKPKNEPAFPVESCADHEFTGMSLRDYFATHTSIDHDEVGVRYAAAIVGRDMPDFAADPLGNSAFWAEYRARMRYIEADAMLAARSA
ncbi:hypothetical protein [Pseudomonas rhodesiae]|uniref:hypothetical protein n=1 Tax=Pseudomonas rhodesiae TaxID=76760 RepID=UPI00241BF105|nr:hypothetical protein [Pseudomonas rhodesiae]